jgi:hypothetical protein
MDSAWIAVVGTTVGATLGYGSAWLTDAQRWQREAKRDMRNQRLAACMRLLDACRELRYVARGRFEPTDGSASPAQIDEWRTQASVAEYEIQVLCRTETVTRAKTLLRSTLDYLGLRRDDPNVEDWETFRHAARLAASDFVTHLRFEFGAAD